MGEFDLRSTAIGFLVEAQNSIILTPSITRKSLMKQFFSSLGELNSTLSCCKKASRCFEAPAYKG
jgi:hypothetical protein